MPSDGVEVGDGLFGPVLFQVDADGVVQDLAWSAALVFALEKQGLPEGLVDEKHHPVISGGDTAFCLRLVGGLGAGHDPECTGR